jgi:glycosyltransferase involved in cell wall biosynthesis
VGYGKAAAAENFEAMSQSKMLSIICPTYNRASFLEGCVAPMSSFRNLDFEFIIVDDCSTDETSEVVERLQAQYGADQVHYFRLEKNSGAQEARNRGILESRGDFFMFVDSDDVLVPDGVSKLLKKLEKPRLDYAYGKVLMTDESLKPLAGKGPIGAGFEDSPIEVAGYHWHTMGPIYRRRCIDKVGLWNLDLTGSQDWEYQARVKFFGGRGEFVDTLVGYWRQHTGGRVGTRSFRPDYVRSVMKACDSIHQHAKRAGKCDAALQRRLAKKLIVHAIEWGANGYRKDKSLCLSQAATMAYGNFFLSLVCYGFHFSPQKVDRFVISKIYGSN